MRNVPGVLCSTADMTLSSAPRLPLRVPKMAKISPPKWVFLPPELALPAACPLIPVLAESSDPSSFLAKNISVLHSSSIARNTLPPFPITNPTQFSGTCTMLMSSRFMVGSMWTGPTL